MINIQIKYMIRLYQKNKAKFKQKENVLYGTTTIGDLDKDAFCTLNYFL